MNGFQRRREQKKQTILETSLALFLQHGIQSVTIATIAKKAKVSQVTIYNYFESKENLVYHVFTYYVDHSIAAFKEIIDSNLSFPEKVKNIIFRKKEAAQNIHEEFYCFIMDEYSNKGNYIEKKFIEKALPYFKELFDKGRAEGYIKQNLSDEAIFIFIQMISDYVQRKDVYENILPFTEELTSMFFYGIFDSKKR